MELLSGLLASIPVWLLWTVIVGIAVYWYSTRNYNYWKDLGIPYVTPLPFLGSIGKLLINPQHLVEVERYKTKGQVYGAYEGSRAVLVVGDLDVAKDILVKDFHFFTGRRNFSISDSVINKNLANIRGEDWKRVRTLITPSFTTGKLKKMTSILIDSAKALCENFRKCSADDKPFDVKRIFGTFTMDVIASSVFGTKLDSHNDPSNPFVTTARLVISNSITWRIAMFFLFPSIMKTFRIPVFPPGALKFFEDVTLKIIQERKRSGKRRADLLQLLMDAEEELEKTGFPKENDEVTEMGHEENNDQVFKPIRGSNKSLSNEELLAQCLLFFIAGFDAVASILSFTVYELALNPHIQEKLIAEIDESIREKGELRYETIFEMKYLDRVVSEIFRKYPLGIRAERIADEDYKLKNYDITVPKGMLVGIPIYAIHHDPQYYPDPDKFDPERFNQDVKATRNSYAYMPFGAGPRNCVAMRFALTEIKVCLAYILSQFRFHTCSQTAVPLKYFQGQPMLSPKEVILKLEARSHSLMD